MNFIAAAFKKMLGNGRAWMCVDEFTSEFINVITSPILELAKKVISLKYTHFTTLDIDENNIVNHEELFNITPKGNLQQRAEEIDLAWGMLSGNSNFKTLETFLQRAGFELYVSENVNSSMPDLGTAFNYGFVEYDGEIDDKKAQYGGHSGRIIGNGFLNIAGTIKDPAQFVDGKNAFYITGYFDPTDSEWDRIIEIVLKLKPLHNVAVCKIAERKRADNEYYNTESFANNIDGGDPATQFFIERLNTNGGV